MLTLIAAVAKNRVIGRAGKIPWNIPEDMKHFREMTTGNVIVMGRHTYEEIGHPLPGRMNYLISTKLQIEEENCHTVTDLREVLEREPDREVFICGGQSLYEEALPLADRLCLTELDYEVEGDTWFPDWHGQFRQIKRTPAAESPSVYFTEWVRKDLLLTHGR